MRRRAVSCTRRYFRRSRTRCRWCTCTSATTSTRRAARCRVCGSRRSPIPASVFGTSRTGTCGPRHVGDSPVVSFDDRGETFRRLPSHACACVDARVQRVQKARAKRYQRHVSLDEDKRVRGYRTLPLEWSSTMAYVVGLLATDGCLSKDRRHIILTSCDG